MPEKDSNKAKHSCPKCLSTNVYGMSRVVGYYSIIENWNESKLAELKDRQKGFYKIAEPKKLQVPQKFMEEPIKVTVKSCC